MTMYSLAHINPRNNNQNDYLKLCYNVMRDIRRKHDSIICNEDHIEESLVEIYERNYMITFSYLMGMRNKSHSIIDSDEFISGELYKEVGRLDKRTSLYQSMTELAPKRVPNYLIPDFLIHKSNRINDKNVENQLLILEAKTTQKLTPKGFNWDMFKLNMYIEKLNFNVAVYLIVNSTLKKINKFVDNYIRNYWYSDKLLNYNQLSQMHHLYFLIQEKVDSNPEIYELVFEN